MMSRERLILDGAQLENLGFVEKNNGGDDPRDYWYEIQLSNPEKINDVDVTLCCDGYLDFSLTIEDSDNVPLNFKNSDEIKLFIEVFTRPYNHAFSFILDV
jgi:hypothetical protein